MQDHVIVCGAGSTGGYIVDELVASKSPVVAIDLDEEELRKLAERHPGDLFSYVVGDATDEETLAKASLATARGIVTAMPNDKDNIYIIVETRSVNPRARIIAKAAERGHVDRIRKVGADGIVTPAYIGGMRMISEMMRPMVVRFLDDMLRDTRTTYRIDEVTIVAKSELDGMTFADAQIRQRFHVTVLAITYRGGPWNYNPDAKERLVPGMTLVVLGSVDDVRKLRAAAVC